MELKWIKQAEYGDHWWCGYWSFIDGEYDDEIQIQVVPENGNFCNLRDDSIDNATIVLVGKVDRQIPQEIVDRLVKWCRDNKQRILIAAHKRKTRMNINLDIQSRPPGESISID